MARMAAFRFTVMADEELTAAFRRHTGARRFAYNRCLQMAKEGLDHKRRHPTTTVPWSGFDLINAFNTWKRSEDAGRLFSVDSAGTAQLADMGLFWRDEVCAQVFEEAAVDLGRSLRSFSASKKAVRQGKQTKKVGFPRYVKKGTRKESFRLRNRTSANGRSSIRIGEHGPRSITLPFIGPAAVREDTRRLRRLLRPGEDGSGRARICYATVCEHRGRYVVVVACELPELHPEMRHDPARVPSGRSFVGVDRGLKSYAVAAWSDGSELLRVDAPRPLGRAMVEMRRASRSLSRKVAGSSNRKKAAKRLNLLHARIADQRSDFLHRLSSSLVKTHDAICLEDLAVSNLIRNPCLARPIADAAWGTLARQIAYKSAWYDTVLVVAPRFFPSTKTCSGCGWVRDDMRLGDRVFACRRCGLAIDRDRNAAANLAAWAEAECARRAQAPDREALGRVTNACGGGSAGRWLAGGATTPATSPGEKKQEPTRAGAA
ncbi:MAG TPA: RNA-guided endonuclease TnpB family protein [Acidimicrobiales bacterium]|nr:RNA-guided endonuclease TnpB family protein [Acidimicrobiales bacterium]